LKKQPIKILQVINHGTLGGTERHVLQLVQHLDKSLFNITVASLEKGPLIAQFKKLGVSTVVLSRKHRADISFIPKLYLFLKRNQFDIIHAHGSQLPGWIGRLASVPISIETRHGLRINQSAFQKMPALTRLKQQLKIRLSGPLLTVSENDRKILIEQFNAKPQQIYNIYNGVDIDAIEAPKKHRPAIRKALGFSDTDFIIGTLARLMPQKGLKHLIDALAILKDIGVTPHCLLVGDGPERPALVNQMQDLGLDASIHFLGFKNDAWKYLHTMDCFILPSIWEGLPYALLEAMAAKKPVIATAIFGMEEILTHEQNGLLVQSENPIQLAEAIQRLYTNRDLAKKLATNGRQLVEQTFSVDVMTHKITQYYLSKASGVV